MGKASRRPKTAARFPKINSPHKGSGFGLEGDMDDEIDAFHKQRDVIPLNVNADDGGSSDEDMEQPVFDLKGGDDSDSEDYDKSDDDNDDDNDDDGISDEVGDKFTLAAKISRQAKFLQQRIGGVEDDMHDDGEPEEEKRSVWGRHKNVYFGADNADFEQLSSDEELLAEGNEALRMQKENTKFYSFADFGLDEDVEDFIDPDKQEKTQEDIFVAGKSTSNALSEGVPAMTENYVEIKRDLSALSKKEKMDVVYRFSDSVLSKDDSGSAPELVGLLSELNEALNQLKKVKSFLCKVNEQKNIKEGLTQYLEVKRRILLAYCQAIGFYLLLKSEGHSVHDHPVVARLVELKSLLEKVKQIDVNVPSEIEVIKQLIEPEKEVVKEIVTSDSLITKTTGKTHNAKKSNEIAELVKVGLSKDNGNKPEQNGQVGIQSKEMLKVRASLEEKLKQKGVFSSLKPRPTKNQNHASHLVNKQLETLTDFDDEVAESAFGNGMHNGQSRSSKDPTKLSRLVSKKPALVSGDDDLPKRDDIGERRRKHELRVLARAGAGCMECDDNELDEPTNAGAYSMDMDTEDNEDEAESEDEFYKEAKQQRSLKLFAKAEILSRAPVVPSSLLEPEADGKRQITYQIEKNRGLTRHRKKLTKIPRKKYKMKHKKATIRRKGQVRDIRKPSGPYGGETTGINAGISRSIRFNN